VTLGRNYKSLNENLAPLMRYLHRQVNRPWSKVWSEISAHLKATNTVQQHVRDHVVDFVAMRTFIANGDVWVAGRRGAPVPLAKSWHQLYVDPRTGILRRNKHFKRDSQISRETMAADARERAPRMRELGSLLQLHLFKDCWWEVTLAPVPAARRADPPASEDVVIRAGLTGLPAHELYGRRGVYAVKKRQLTSPEIADLGLKA